MRTSLGISALVWASLFSVVGSAESLPSVQPLVVNEQSLTFTDHPHVQGLSAAWAIGSEKGGGSYSLRVRLRDKSILPPHTHPDTRITTVLRGTLSLGFGRDADPTKSVTAGPGDTYLVPAGIPHFLMARDGDVEYSECGAGVTGTQMVSSQK